MELTDGISSPEIFRRWAAISCLAGAMERRVWLRFNRRTLYPNMYVLLIGPAGVGKGMAMGPVEELWREVEEFHLAPSSVSKASLMDTLRDARRQLLRPSAAPPDNHIEYNSLLVAAREFGHFLPAYDNEFMAALTDVWDGMVYEERKRGAEIKFKIEKPFLHILGGTTPSYMMTTFPEIAWEQGFASRTVMIYSGQNIHTDPFADDLHHDSALFDALAADLRVVANAYGKMDWSEEATRAFQAWNETGGNPKPSHPKLIGYLTRRVVNLAKLCMVATISRADHKFHITLEDYQQAFDWFLQAEAYMEDMFKSFVVGGDARALEDTYHYMHTLYAKTRKPMHQTELVSYIAKKVPAHSVMRIIEIMENSGDIVKDGEARGMPFYRPVPKALH